MGEAYRDCDGPDRYGGGGAFFILLFAPPPSFSYVAPALDCPPSSTFGGATLTFHTRAWHADLAWLAISRFILLDSLLLFFTFTTVYCLACFNNQQRRSVVSRTFHPHSSYSDQPACLAEGKMPMCPQRLTTLSTVLQTVRRGLVDLVDFDRYLDRLRLLVGL